VKTLQEVRESDMGSRDTPDYFTTRATIVSIKQDNIAYPACKSENCNKKVTQVGSGWQCEKCDKTWPEPEYR
jgi:replication factor A1